MGKNTSVTLSEHFEGFIAQEIASGRFGNVSEVIRAGLRLLEREERKLAALRAAVAQGDASPEGQDVSGKQFFAELRGKHGLEPRNG
jgi:antitoxin ParD1/3/4